MRAEKVSIIGSGFIGRSFAMIFASVGYQVCLYDVERKQLDLALVEIKKQLTELKASGNLKGTLSVDEQFSCIKVSNSLKECIENSFFIQECVPEILDLKIKVFKDIDALTSPTAILSSSSSCIMPSKFTENLIHRANCIVSHPINPPYHVPALEIVPAPWTEKNIVSKVASFWKEIGMLPVVFDRECSGFGVNRLQYALLNECMRLVQDGILTTEGVDTLIRDGLAMRYVWCGPFEVCHLNANGITDYFSRYGESVRTVSDTFGPTPSWTVASGAAISAEMEQRFPLDTLQKRCERRDERLAVLNTLKKKMKEKED